VDTFYNIVRKMECDGFTRILANIEKTTCERTMVDGKDSIKITYPGSFIFKFSETPGANKVSSKIFFSLCPKTLPSPVLGIAFRFRVERVGKAMKLMKPYCVTKVTLVLKENQPIEARQCAYYLTTHTCCQATCVM
jgi:hypothetical protein